MSQKDADHAPEPAPAQDPTRRGRRTLWRAAEAAPAVSERLPLPPRPARYKRFDDLF